MTALIYAVFNASLPQEIFLRDFLLKRISNELGYMTAIIIQGTIFGLLHGIMFISIDGVIKTVIIILSTGIIPFAMGCVNERKVIGSIFPSWIIHASANTFASIVAMFSLIYGDT